MFFWCYHRVTITYVKKFYSPVLINQTHAQFFFKEFVQRINVFSKNQRVAVRNYSIEVAPLVLQQLGIPSMFLAIALIKTSASLLG